MLDLITLRGKRSRYSIAVLAVSVLLGACGDGAQQLAGPQDSAVLSRAGGVTTVHINERFPFNPTIFNSCTDEMVDFTGSLNLAWHMTFDSEGNLLHEKFHAGPQGVSGIGQTSGRRYRLAGAENNSFSTKPSGAWQVMFVGVMRMLSAGANSNSHLHFQFFVKVDAEGNFNLHLGNVSVECR